jgi:hypothetical protein
MGLAAAFLLFDKFGNCPSKNGPRLAPTRKTAGEDAAMRPPQQREKVSSPAPAESNQPG